MKRAVLMFALSLLAFPAIAKTSATIDRTRVVQGQAVMLTIATDQVGAPDYSALRSRFRVEDVASERSVRYANGSLSVDLRYRVELIALQPGIQTIPALVVGHDRTQPLQLEVVPSAGAASTQAAAMPAQPAPQVQPMTAGQGPIFVQTRVDDRHPYVQQAVGVVVRLYYATQMLDGALDLDTPTGASLRRVGEDVQGSEDVGGRRYAVIERHYVLVPDRSGPLTLPAARFSGHGQGGFFDDLFGDGRENLHASGQPQVLQVRAAPTNAAQPWLPLHRLDLRTIGATNVATAGQTLLVTLRMQADGANAAQLPDLVLTADSGAQVYPEAPTMEDGDNNGRPQATVTRRFSVVPARAGQLHLQAAPIQWWNVGSDQPEAARLQPLTVDVAPGTGTFAQPAATQAETTVANRTGWLHWPRSGLVWGIVAAVFGLLWIATLAWGARRRAGGTVTADVPATSHSRRSLPPSPQAGPDPLDSADLKQALASGDLSRIAHALQRMADPPAADLDALKARLQPGPQVEAVDLLQAALWGNGRVDAATALSAVRAAFREGPSWRSTVATKTGKPVLPPLYPER